MIFRGKNSDDVVETHAKQISHLQDQEAKRLLAPYREARRDLQDRLRRTRGDTFTAQQLRGTLAQVNAGIAIMGKQLHQGLKESSFKAAFFGNEHLVKEIHRFEKRFRGAVVPIPLDAVKVATNTSNFLVNQYQASINHYDAAMRSKITRQLTQSAIEELPTDKVINKIGDFFEGQEWEIWRLARTEMHHMYSLGKLNGMKEVKKDTIPDLMKALYHPMDARTGEDSIELAQMNPILPLDEYFEQDYQATPKSKVQHYKFLTPPNRPNDRAILIPYREDWDSDTP